uniref:RNase H type-1 domain-containing protein n=2 Tax=Fagus sylvatica TaxID=28930 RepID=A0A2N9GBE2_FAGSY
MTGEDGKTSGIEKFDGTNFGYWKMQIEDYLYGAEMFNIDGCESIANLVIDPPIEHCYVLSNAVQVKEQRSLQLAITIEAIWNLRNRVVHNGEQINIAVTIKGTEFRFAECIEAREPVVDKDPNSVKLWTRPPIGMVKLNVDATIFSDKCWLAVVARDDRGNIVKYWSKAIPPNEPVVAEANAILWAIQIAKEEDFKDIIVEGDAKIYFDVLNGNVGESLWSISSLCRDIKFL